MSAVTSALAVLALLAAIVILVGQPRRAGGDASALPAAGQGRAAVIVAFQRGDCGASNTSLAAWNAVADDGAVAVTGLLIGERNAAASAQVAEEFGLRFPLVPDRRGRGERFLMALGYGTTPIVVAMDDGGRIRYTAPWNVEDRREILAAVRAVARSTTTQMQGAERTLAPFL